eukprot:9376764-Pyramimonas_sp.AAC.1
MPYRSNPKAPGCNIMSWQPQRMRRCGGCTRRRQYPLRGGGWDVKGRSPAAVLEGGAEGYASFPAEVVAASPEE